jgi:PucR family transcriptional regulator, purine catabolism regulatory protein
MNLVRNKKLQIKDILELEVFAECKVVAGVNGLSKEIQYVTVAEVPDSANWIVGGELVVSTGYFIRDSVDTQKEWILSLINKGAAALAIKPERFLGKTSEQLKHIADKHSFPLIELPHNVVWPSVINSVTELLNGHNNEIIRKTEEIHNRLTELVLNGGGMNEIAKTLADLVETPIIVEDCLLNTLSVRIPKNSISTYDYQELIDYRTSNTYQDKFKNSVAYRESIVERNKKLFNMIVEVKGYGRISQKVLPIVANNVLYGFLSAIEHNEKQVNEIDILALEHGATTIALDMMMERVKIESANRAKSTLMNELIKGDTIRAVSSYMNYQITNYDMLRPSVVIIIKIKNQDQLWIDQGNEKLYLERHDKKISKFIEKKLTKFGYESFVDFQGNLCTILIPYPTKTNRVQFMSNLKEHCNSLLERLKTDYKENDYIIGIGDPYFQIEDLKKSYQKAEMSMSLTQKFLGFNQVSVYSELGILKLLSLIDNQAEIDGFCFELIGNLIEYDKTHNDQMCETLYIYLMNNGNNLETSKILFLHPNTLNYRIKKISKILGLDLNNSHVRFNLYLALSIKKIYMDEYTDIESIVESK